MKDIRYRPIGIIHSPFEKPEGTPVQSGGGIGVDGTIEVFKEYVDGLKDLEGFSHIILIYDFHLSSGQSLIVKPYLDDIPHGVFATRSPSRPNNIGISIVNLINIEKNLLQVQDMDIVEGTPLLDIKPYVREFDVRDVERIGWLEKCVHKMPKTIDDGRFNK